MKNIIPPVTHPLGERWNQPLSHEIEVDDTHALMSRGAFEELFEYGSSHPSGVYEGKMWTAPHAHGNVLYWYGPSETPDMCSINVREILIVEERTDDG